TTFDPLVIQRLGVLGAHPDIGEARHWYQRAAELGSNTAAQRLARLAAAPRRIARCCLSLPYRHRLQLDAKIPALNSGRLRQLLRCANPDNAAALDDVMAIDDPRQRLDVFIDDEDRLPTAAKAFKRLPDFIANAGR